MKYLKMLGLAAIAAMALTAFLGAGSASATVLCQEAPTKNGICDKDYASGTTIHAVLESGKEAVLNGFWTDVECKKSTVQGSTSNTGGASETVSGNISVLTFEECECANNSGPAHVTVLEEGSLEVHVGTGGDGTLTGKNQRVTINCTPLGSSCIFGTSATGVTLGTVTGGTPATMKANAVVNRITGDGGVLTCGSTATWEAPYEITSPSPLFIGAS